MLNQSQIYAYDSLHEHIQYKEVVYIRKKGLSKILVSQPSSIQ